jgi:hypothetical protein
MAGMFFRESRPFAVQQRRVGEDEQPTRRDIKA